MRNNAILTTLMLLGLAIACDDTSFSGAPATGQGGSMTRFAISGNYMYVVDNSSLTVFDVAGAEFRQLNNVSIQPGLETVFARGEYLYLGAQDGMYIYSIADPSAPSFIFQYQHIVSCDPVVVQGDRAYVTLRSGNFCNRGVNLLEIIDISDPHNPTLIEDHPMESPHGLGIDGNLLFVCEGEYGLKVFDVSDEHQVNLITQRRDFFAYDVILRDGLATVTGDDGIFQFSYDESGITLVSRIPVVRAAL